MRLGALNPEEPFSGETILTETGENNIRVNDVIESSRKQFAIKYVEKPPGQSKRDYKVIKRLKSPKKIAKDFLPLIFFFFYA